MTESERDALIGQTCRERQALKRARGCLAAKADRMRTAVAQGVRLLTGEATGHFTNGVLHVAVPKHGVTVGACDWPSAEEIGDLLAERDATEKRLAEVERQLRDMGIGD